MKNSNCEKLQRAKFDHQDGSTYWVGARVVITKHTHTHIHTHTKKFSNPRIILEISVINVFSCVVLLALKLFLTLYFAMS